MDHCESDDGVWNRSPPKKRYIAALQNFCTNIQYINTTSALDFERLITLKFRIREQEIPLKVLEISYFFSFSCSMAESPPKKENRRVRSERVAYMHRGDGSKNVTSPRRENLCGTDCVPEYLASAAAGVDFQTSERPYEFRYLKCA